MVLYPNFWHLFIHRCLEQSLLSLAGTHEANEEVAEVST